MAFEIGELASIGCLLKQLFFYWQQLVLY